MQSSTPQNSQHPSSSTSPKIKSHATTLAYIKSTHKIMAPFSTNSPPTSPLTDLSKSPTPPISPTFWAGFSDPKSAGLNIQNASRPSRKKNALERYSESQFQPQRRTKKRQRSESPEIFDNDESATIAAKPTQKKAKKSGELQFISYVPTKSHFGRQSKPTQKAANVQSNSNGDLPTPPSTDDSVLSIPTSPQSSPISASRAKGKKKGKEKTPRPMTAAKIDAELDTRAERKPMLWSSVQASKGNGGHLPPVTGPSAPGGICLPGLTAAEKLANAGASGITKPVANVIEADAAPYQSAFDDEIRAMVALEGWGSRKRTRGAAVTSTESEQPAAKKVKTAPVNEPPRFSLSPESSHPISAVRDEPAPHLDFGAGAMSGFSDIRESVSFVRDEAPSPDTVPTSPNNNTNGYISPSSSSATEPSSPTTQTPTTTTAAGTPKKPTKIRFNVSGSKKSTPEKSKSTSKAISETGKKPYVSPYVSVAAAEVYNGPPIHYFAYGVDMAPSYMSTHYPGSTFISTAKLSGYKWIIGSKDKVKAVPGSKDDNVWGAVYTIHPSHLTHLIHKGSKSPRSSRMLSLPISLFARNKKIGWFGNETEACLIPGPVLQANVLVGKADVLVGKERGGEVVKLERENVTAKRLNRALVEVCPEGVDSEWIGGVVRRCVPRPVAGGGLYW